MDEFKLKNGSGSLCRKGCGRQDNKLNAYDWLADVPGSRGECDMVEVQFKNTRKGYFRNANGLSLEKGDVVAVEASPGHDIGTVSMTGRLVRLQMRKCGVRPDAEVRRVYRKAKPADMEKYVENIEYSMGATDMLPIKLVVNSYKGKTTLTFTRSIYESDIIKEFFRFLTKECGAEVYITGNGWGE